MPTEYIWSLLPPIVVVVPSPSCVWLFVTPLDCSTPGLPVPHHLPEFAQVDVHFIGDAIEPSHPLMPSSLLLPSIFPSIRDFSKSRLFASDDQNTGASASASVLQMRIQGWFLLRLTSFISLLWKGYLGIFSSTTVWRHQFFGSLPSLQSSSHTCTRPLGRPLPWLYGSLLAEWCLCFSTHVYICHSFPAKKKLPSDFMAAVTICSDFRAQEEEIWYYFHFFLFYLSWSNGARCHDHRFLIFSFKLTFFTLLHTHQEAL